MAGTPQHSDPDSQTPDGSSPTYHPPAYLARQAAQSQPLSPYASRGTSNVRRANTVGCTLLLVFVLVLVCSAGANAAGGFFASLSATPTTSLTSDNRAPNSGLAVATDTPTPAPTDIPTLAPTPTPSPTAMPTPVPTDTPIPQPTCIPGAINCNPWGYNFSCCGYIYNPPSNFCNYFACIPSFLKHTNGYIEECKDGDYSHSGGVQGSCSYHGGNWRPLLQR